MKKQRKQITIFSGVIIKDTQILMTQRSEKECPDADMKWEFPGGKVDFGETPQEAVKRELLEETGVEVRVEELLPFLQTNYWEYTWGIQQTLCFIFLCNVVTEHLPKKDHHVAQVKWMSFAKAVLVPSLPGTKDILELVRNRYGTI